MWLTNRVPDPKCAVLIYAVCCMLPAGPYRCCRPAPHSALHLLCCWCGAAVVDQQLHTECHWVLCGLHLLAHTTGATRGLLLVSCWRVVLHSTLAAQLCESTLQRLCMTRHHTECSTGETGGRWYVAVSPVNSKAPQPLSVACAPLVVQLPCSLTSRCAHAALYNMRNYKTVDFLQSIASFDTLLCLSAFHRDAFLPHNTTSD